MAEELVSTVGILATSMANCNVVRADENGVVVLPEFPKTTGGITLGGGGYIPGQGIVIGSGNGLVEGYENTQIIIGNEACVKKYNGDDSMVQSYNDFNIVIGNGASVESGDAVAIGDNAFATLFSTALGTYACASGNGSMALGTYACASGLSSTALGDSACAEGTFSTALGRSAQASGGGSTALGAGAIASGSGSMALGGGASADEYSTAIGSSSRASYGALMIKSGRSNDIEQGVPTCHAFGNEILLMACNECQTNEDGSSCLCHGCQSYLKVTREGKLIVNDTEISPTSSTDIGNAIADKVSTATTINTTDNNFTLSDVATALNTLITLLKTKQ